MTRRLPGLQPLPPSELFYRDEAFCGQMDLRDRLLADSTDRVLAHKGSPGEMEEEALGIVLETVGRDDGYGVCEKEVRRPDGVGVSLDWSQPLATAGRLVQEDIILLRETPNGHILHSGVVCFPASWTLAEKIGRSIAEIHKPVDRYDEALGRRVETVLGRIRAGAPLWRANWLRYNSPDLFHPLPEGAQRPFDPERRSWVRVEKQALARLPVTGSLLFVIHTQLVAEESLTSEEHALLRMTPAPLFSVGRG